MGSTSQNPYLYGTPKPLVFHKRLTVLIMGIVFQKPRFMGQPNYLLQNYSPCEYASYCQAKYKFIKQLKTLEIAF